MEKNLTWCLIIFRRSKVSVTGGDLLGDMGQMPVVD